MTKTYSFLKPAFLSIACLLFNLTVVFSQGNVGIGTTTPSLSMDIEGSRADEGIHINQTNTANRAIISFQESGTGKFTMGVDLADDIFKIGTTAIGTNTRLTINPNGNLGVGMPNAVKRLAVSCTGASNGITIANTDGVNGDPVIAFELEGPTSAFTLGVDDDDNDAFKICTGGVLGANAAFTVKSDGNIGMGAGNPISKLHISRSDAVDNLLAIEQSNGGDFDPYVRFENGSTFWSAGLDDSDVDKFKISSNTSLGTNDRLVIQTDGNVGVNTTAPKHSLHVNGSIGSAYTVQAGDYTATATDFFILMNATAANRTLTLPAKAGSEGRIYVVKQLGANTVTIDPNGAELIEGSATINVGGANKSVMIFNDGGGWQIMAVK